MSKGKRVVVKCRFCGEQLDGFGKLRAHVSKSHEAEAKAISESLPAYPTEVKSPLDRGAGRLGVAWEFRRRLGYSPGSQG